MKEPKFEWQITDLSEIAIRGTDEIPIFISEPYWSIVEIKYPNFTAIVHSGKKRLTHSFRSDDIEKALEIIKGGGEEKEISKGLATHEAWAGILMKHCIKLQNRIDKANKPTIKKKTKNRNKKVIKSIEPDKNDRITCDLKVNLDKDVKMTLNNWM